MSPIRSLFSLVVLSFVLASCGQTARSASAGQSTAVTDNKAIVTAFFDLAFVQGKPEEAANRWISPTTYIQHNPDGADGRQAFITGMVPYLHNTGYRATIKRVIAEGSLVVVHSHGIATTKGPGELGEASIDIFRIENGLIVEHWDVIQPVPKTSANTNGMF